MTTRKHPQRYARALALEPRILLDAAAVATAAEVVTATDTTPGVTASGVAATISIDDASGQQSIDLFSNVSVSLDSSSEELTDLVITVDSSGANQALIIDGSTIALVTTSYTSTTDNAYTYSVAVSGNTTTITISIASSETGYTAAATASLIDSIAYATLDNTVESGTVNVTLSTLSDDNDTATLDISSSISITSTISVAPTLSEENTLEATESFSIDDADDDTQVVYSSDGNYAYVVSNGSLSVFEADDSGRLSLVQELVVDDLDQLRIGELVISPDNSTLYVYVVTASETVSNTASIVQLNIADDGTVSYAATTYISYAVQSGGGLAISDDGLYLYVGTWIDGTRVYSLDSSTGALSESYTRVSTSNRNSIIATSGDYVYVAYGNVSDHTLVVYSRNDDGSLSEVTSYLFSSTGGSVDFSLAISDDGQYLYLADPSTDTISVYQFDGSTLTLLETATLANVTDIALSDDGSLLFASSSDDILTIYAVSADGALSQISQIEGVSAGDIAVSSDGLSLLVAGSSGVTRYSLAKTLNTGESVTVASGVTLADSNSDILNSGAGNYNGASIVITTSVTGGTFDFAEDNGLRLANGYILRNGSPIASFTTASDGTLTITFSANVSTEVANQVLQQITYSNDDATAGSYIALGISVNDGTLTSSVTTVTLRVNTLPQLDSAVATGYTLRSATSETAYSFTLFSGLFSDADGDALTWTVSGLPDGLTFDAETLTISGAALEAGTFTLTVTVTDASGASASLELSLEVEQIANRAPEVDSSVSTSLALATESTAYSTTLDSALFSDADSLYGDSLTWTVSGLPDGFTFDADTLTISGTSSTVADYTLTVTVTDESGATASTELTLRVISTEEANNNAPSLSTDDVNLTYTVDGNLTGFSQYVYSLELSSDDSTLLVVGSSSGGHSVTPSGNSTLYVYSRDSDGNLTLVQTFVQGTSDDGDASNGIEIDGLDSATSAVYSADGQYVYLVGKNSSGTYTVTTLQVNDDGTLSSTGLSVTISDSSTVRQMVVSDDGKALYIVSNSYLYAYATADDGSLTLLGSYTDGISSSNALTIANGVVYVAGSSRVAIYTVNDDGSLTWATTWSGGSTFMRSIAATDDGYVYVSRGTSGIQVLYYDKDSNTVTSVGQYASSTQFWGLTLSADGTALYAGQNSGPIYVYQVNDDGTLTLSQTLANSSGRAFRFAMSADGSSIYYGGFYLFTGMGQISTAVGAAYTEGGTTSPFSVIELSDVEYDALNDGAGNYNGAVISVVRSGGANAADSFGFADGNDLTYSDGVIYLSGTAIATLSNASGTLTLTFTADVTTATANLVLQQITYSNTSNDPGSSITLVLSLSDQYTTSSLNVLLTVAEINDAPTLETEAIAATYVSGASGVRLFEGTSVSALEEAQSISSLTLTVAGVSSGASETLTIDGTSIALVAGTTTTTSGYSVTVTLDGSTASVTISSSAGIAVADAASLVDSITYSNSADTSGSRTVTLTAVKDNGGTSNGGVDTTTLSIATTVTLSATNSAPTLTSTAATVSYTENGAATTLFSGTSVSTVEGGQSIIALTLSVSGVTDGDSETLLIDGTSIALVDGTTTTTNGYSVTVSLSGTTATLSITSASGIPASTLATLVDGIAYANSSDDPTAGNRSVTLTSVQDNGGTSNSGSDTTTLNIATTISVVAVNDAPVLEASATTAVYAASGSSATLFSGTQIDLVESGQTITSITLTASGLLNGRNETLLVDGTSIALVDGTSGTTSNGYSYSVSVDADGVATLSISASGGIAADAAATLIDGIAYVNLSGTYTAGERSFTLSVSDSGGTANGGSDTSTLASSASLTLVNNSAPVLGSTPDNETLAIIESLTSVSGLDDVTATVLSSDGSTVYAVSSDGTIAIFSRNLSTGALVYLETLDSGLSDVSDIQLSPDDGTLYVLGNSGDAIAIFTRSSVDGSLEAVQVLATTSVSDFAVADDGTLYVVDGNYSGLLVYSLDSAGQYVLTQQISASANSEPYLFTAVDIEVVGDYVYVITNPVSSALADTLIVYTRNSDGSLGDAVYLRDSDDVDLSDPLDLVVSADGSTIYVATTSGVSIFTFADGSLTLTGTIDGLTSVSAIALAADGINLYVSSTEGLSRYDVSDASAAVLLQTLSDVSGVTDLSVAVNGALLASTGSSLVNLRTSLPASLSFAYDEQGELLVASNLTLSDVEHDAMNDGAGNYNGASISISRSGGANADDSYGLSEGNGLSLVDGQILYDGVAIASFVVQDGTLTITFSADVSSAVANAVLQQITYTNTSDDPDSALTLVLSVSDGYGALDSVELAVTVTAINDAPTASSTVLNPSHLEGGAAVQLFQDSTISAVEAGQSITSLTLTIDGLSDGASETLTVDGTLITLTVGTSGTTTNGYAYSVSVDDNGTVTLLITTGSGIDGAAAAALLDSITYANSSDDPTAGTRNISLVALSDDGGSDNGGSDSATLSLTSSVMVLAVNDAPTLTSTGASVTHSLGGSAVSLFSDTSIDTIEANQTILSLTLSVGGLLDGASETLLIDGTSIALVAGTSVVNGYTITVVLDGDIAVVTISSDSGISTADAIALINGIAYANTRGTPSEGVRNITLNAIRDSGGTDNGGSDSSTLAIFATVTVSATEDNTDNGGSDDDDDTDNGGSDDGDGSDGGDDTDDGGSDDTDNGGADDGDTDNGSTDSGSTTRTVTPTLTTTHGFIPYGPTPNRAFDVSPFRFDNAAGNVAASVETATKTPAAGAGSHVRSGGLADGLGSLSQQLAEADGVLTDSGSQSNLGSFSFDGTTLRSSVDPSQGDARRISLQLPVELPNGATPQRVTLGNGLPLPSWASFDARTGELSIDRSRLPNGTVLRLTLISRDAEGKEQRTAVEISVDQTPANAQREATQAVQTQAESLPQRLRQETSGALLSDALALLDQLSDLAAEPAAVTTRHIA
ncbi:beta strand repeat-containing protein [Pseudomonas sp. LRF_L74]|uniref:beta strand repeat-containing protein n=1 Tax=Pseudomonas sp. LRF_L74 TaxID=3369422 RepID=UPI003F637241